MLCGSDDVTWELRDGRLDRAIACSHCETRPATGGRTR